MSNIDKGGPAFPVPSELAAKLGCVSSESDAGMSLLDYFAGQALAGMMARKDSDGWTQREVADDCYLYAESMLATRKRI